MELMETVLCYEYNENGTYGLPTPLETFEEMAQAIYAAGAKGVRIQLISVFDEMIWDSNEK